MRLAEAAEADDEAREADQARHCARQQERMRGEDGAGWKEAGQQAVRVAQVATDRRADDAADTNNRRVST